MGIFKVALLLIAATCAAGWQLSRAPHTNTLEKYRAHMRRHISPRCEEKPQNPLASLFDAFKPQEVPPTPTPAPEEANKEEAEETDLPTQIFKMFFGEPQQGEVVAVGPGSRDETGKIAPIELKKGDKVLFGKWSGTEVKIDGQELLIMKESDVMGVLEA